MNPNPIIHVKNLFPDKNESLKKEIRGI